VTWLDLSPPLLLDKYYSQGERGERDEFSLSSHFQPNLQPRPSPSRRLRRPDSRSPSASEGASSLWSCSARRSRRGENTPRPPVPGSACSELPTAQRHARLAVFNVDPQVASESLRYGPFFLKMLQANGFPTHRVAVELIETPFEDETHLGAASSTTATRLPHRDRRFRRGVLELRPHLAVEAGHRQDRP